MGSGSKEVMREQRPWRVHRRDRTKGRVRMVGNQKGVLVCVDLAVYMEVYFGEVIYIFHIKKFYYKIKCMFTYKHI